MSDVRNCPDCGAPVGDDRLPTIAGCWNFAQLAEAMRREGRGEEEITRVAQGGGDPPCFGHNYDYDQEQRSRQRKRMWMVLAAVMLALAVLAALIAGGS